MLDRRRDQVAALARPAARERRAADGQVIAFGTPRREHNFLWLCAEQFGNPIARVFDRFERIAAAQIHRGGIAKRLAKKGQHGLKHLRVHRRRRRMVEINTLLAHRSAHKLQFRREDGTMSAWRSQVLPGDLDGYLFGDLD